MPHSDTDLEALAETLSGNVDIRSDRREAYVLALIGLALLEQLRRIERAIRRRRPRGRGHDEDDE